MEEFNKLMGRETEEEPEDRLVDHFDRDLDDADLLLNLGIVMSPKRNEEQKQVTFVYFFVNRF